MTDRKTTILSITLFTVLTTLWVYLYSQTGISFDHSFNFVKVMNMFSLELILMLLAVGALLSGAITSLNFFRTKISEKGAILTALIGSIVPLVLLFSLFTNQLIFILMMLFYAAGAVLLVLFPSSKKRKENNFKALKIGWSNSKKVLYLLALGGFIIGMLATFSSLEQKQDQFMDGIVNMTSMQAGQIDMGEIITGENGEEIGLNMSREDYRQDIFIPTIIPEYNKTLNKNGMKWSDISSKQQETVFNESYNNFQETYSGDELASKLESSMSESINEKIQKEMSGQIAEQLFESIPLFKTMMDLLPVLTGILIGSLILMYGLIFVSPFCAVMNPLMPKRKGFREEYKK